MNEFRQWFASLPFTTKWLTVFSLLLPLLMKFYIISPYWLVWELSLIVKKLQLWRGLTCLFLTKVNFNFILSLYFRYQYSFYLETDVFAGRPADYLYFVLLSTLLLNILNYFTQMAAMWQSFSMAIVYLWCQHNRQVIVNFMFGFRFPALYLPLILGAFEFLLAGDFFGPVLGVVVAHTYYVLSTVYAERDPRWKSRLQAPRWLAIMVPKLVPGSRDAAGASHGYTVQKPKDPSESQSPSFRAFVGRGQKLGQ